MTYLRGSRAGRRWLRAEKEAREASIRAGGRNRRARRGEREFSLGSFDSEEGSEGGVVDLDSSDTESELDQAEAERARRSLGVEPSVGRRTVDLSDSDDDEEGGRGVSSRSSSVGGRRSKRKVVESSEEEEEEDVERAVGAGRAARRPGSRSVGRSSVLGRAAED